MAETANATARPLPSCRLLTGLTAIKVSRFVSDTSVHTAMQSVGMAFPLTPGELSGSGPWLVWLNPREALALGPDAAPLRQLLATLAPGRSETAMAVDVSDSFATFELQGPRLENWLSHVVDASAIPPEAGRATRCRLIDIPVMLLRLNHECLWLIADRPLGPYLEDWLAYAHVGAFAGSS